MKINWSKLFTFSVSDSKYFDDNRVKIEYTGCNINKKTCLDYLPEINNHFRSSEILYRDKEFNRALDVLEGAYNLAGQLQEPDCIQCALFFQATIVQSMENIHYELGQMSKGIFATNRYQASFLKAEELLKKVKTPKKEKPVCFIIKETSTLEPAVM